MEFLVMPQFTSSLVECFSASGGGALIPALERTVRLHVLALRETNAMTIILVPTLLVAAMTTNLVPATRDMLVL